MSEKIDKPTSLRTQSAWLLFARLVGFALSLLLPLLVVRYLNQDQVGEYRQIFKVILNVSTVLTFGFGMSAYYYLAREKEKHAAAIFNIIIFNFFTGGIACLIFFLFPQLVSNIFGSDAITRLIPKIGIVIWLWVFSTFLENVAVANQESRLATAFIILAQLSKTILMVCAVVIFTSVEAFLYAAIIQGSLQVIILLLYLNSRFPGFWTAFDPKFFREQMVYAIPFGFSGLLWTFQIDIHNYFVWNRFTLAEYAIYDIGCFDLPLIGILYNSVASVLIPRMSQLQVTDDKPEMIRLTARTMQKLAFFYFPIFFFMLVTADTFITTLFTHHYAESAPILRINLILLPFYILISDPIVRAYKELGRALLITRIFIFFGLIAALWFGVQYFDLQGMIAIVVVTALIERFISSGFVMKKLGVSRRDLFLLKNIGKTAIAALIAGIITYFVYHNIKGLTTALGMNVVNLIFSSPKEGIVDFVTGISTLGFSGLIFAPVYLLTTNYLGIIEDEEKEVVAGVWNKVRKFLKIKKDVVQNP